MNPCTFTLPLAEDLVSTPTRNELVTPAAEATIPGEQMGLALSRPPIYRDLPTRNRLLSPAEVDLHCSETHRSRAFVEDFMSKASVSVLVGDSGIGKSALAYQLGLCVAAGVPFLGLKTQRSIVAYADYENGLDGSKQVREALVKFLGLKEAPENFLVWTPDADDSPLNLQELCREWNPELVIIDTLRSHDPGFERSENAGDAMSRLRSTAKQSNASLLFVHHLRKPSRSKAEDTPELDDENIRVIDWMNEASGHRSITNQSDTRVGAALPGSNSGAALVLRWHRRVYGEQGPIFLERVCDEDGEPLGYGRLAGAKLLNNSDQEGAYQKLPKEFAFKDAKYIYGKSDDPTRKWLQKCIATGILTQISRGVYNKRSES